MKKIYELDGDKLAEGLSGLIWYAFDEWPEKARRTIGYQIVRSSDSIAAIIAEGYGRFTPADRRSLGKRCRWLFVSS
jgi:four helix bundle protein